MDEILNFLNNNCVLFTATSKRRSGNRFFMNIEDAKRFCSSDKSQGKMYGEKWAYFFNKLSSVLESYPKECNINNKKRMIKFINDIYIEDNGKYDDLINYLGCTKKQKGIL